MPLTWLDNRVALAQLDKAHRVVSGRLAAAATAAAPGDARAGGADAAEAVVPPASAASSSETNGGRTGDKSYYSVTPRIITLGGDHTTTLSALRSTHKRWGPVSVIHFDSHIVKTSIHRFLLPISRRTVRYAHISLGFFLLAHVRSVRPVKLSILLT